MQIFDISTEHKLPNIGYWFDPNTNKPEFYYKFDKLQLLKTELNNTKSLLDPIYENPDTAKKYEKINKIIRSYDLLKGKNGILVSEYGAEIVTNAWLKMYENMSIFIDLFKSDVNSLHIAEAPGNFLLAINHYVHTQTKIKWNWLASSYKNVYTREKTEPGLYLDDCYGLIRNYPDNWIFGADNDGDITSVNNIKSFKRNIYNMPNHNINFLTSDVKYVPKNNDYLEEENINIPVQFGHTLASLHLLEKSGACMLKEFSIFESTSVSLLYLLANCFEKLYIIKPVTSRMNNSEMYVCGINYTKITDIKMERLFEIMDYIRYKNQNFPAIFMKSDIPNIFYEKIYTFSKILANQQIKAIKQNITNFHLYSDKSQETVVKNYRSTNEKIVNEWIKNNNIKYMEQKYKML